MKTPFIILFLITSVVAFCQSNVYFDQKDMVYPQKAGIYETLEDFLKDSVKYIGEYNEAYNKIKLGSMRWQHAGTVNFGDTYYKYAEATFFGYKDDSGNRYRIMNGGAYVVLAAGDIWLYSQGYRNGIYSNEHEPGGWIKTKKEGKKIQKYATEQDPWVWYAFGVDAEKEKLKNWKKKPNEKVKAALFANDPEIAAAFMADRKKDHNLLFDNSYMNNLERIIYYVTLYNKKHQGEVKNY